MKDKWIIVGVSAILIAAAFWGGRFFYKAKESQAIAQQEASAFVRPHSPRMGNPDAKVTIVEFLDPECESCRAVYPGVKEILKAHEGKVQLVVRYAPFHHNSVFAIKILHAALKQNKYWETLTVLFESQPEWGSHHHPQPEKIWEFLPAAGVDVERIRQEMNDPTTFDLIEMDKADGTKLGVRGTPTFFVNGKPLEEFGIIPLQDAVRREVEALK
jgi:protein-disulfide isomerase